MNHDPLAKFRGDKPGTPAGSPVASASAVYRAFDSKERPARLRMLRANVTRAPAYRYLVDIITDGKSGAEIFLIYELLVVVIKGRNLQTLAKAIEDGTAECIEEFDAARWARPDDKAVIIESLEFVGNEANLPGEAKP